LLVSIEELDKCKRKLRIGLPEGDVAARSAERLSEYGKAYEAPGFRKGKAPKSMVDREFGVRAKIEAIESLMGDAIAEAIRESGIRPVCEPIVEDLESAPTDGHYHFTATIEVRPEIELREYEGLEFTERVPIVSNEDVDRAIEELREANADLAQVTRAAGVGDFVIIDYDRLGSDGLPVPEGKVDGAAYELGADQIPGELEEALLGTSAGDQRAVSLTFPDDSRIEELAGKMVDFDVRVREVREKRLPVVDEAFAKKVAKAETVLDLRVKVRTSLESQAKGFAKRRLEEEIVAALIEKNPFELPECLVRDRLDAMRARMNERRPEGQGEIDQVEFERVYRPVVEHQLKAGLLLNTVAEKHGVEVGPGDVDARVTEIARAQGKDPEELRKDLEGTDLLSQLEDDIWLMRVHDLIVGLSKVTTEQIELPRAADAAAGDGEPAQSG
jgi:trigger factor